jgi:hypothetical protein
MVGCAGHTYEKENIEAWFKRCEPLRSPVTREKMHSKTLVPCLALKEAAAEALLRAKAGSPIASDQHSGTASTTSNDDMLSNQQKIDRWGQGAGGAAAASASGSGMPPGAV